MSRILAGMRSSSTVLSFKTFAMVCALARRITQIDPAVATAIDGFDLARMAAHLKQAKVLSRGKHTYITTNDDIRRPSSTSTTRRTRPASSRSVTCRLT